MFYYGQVCFHHAIGKFAVHKLLYGPEFQKQKIILQI